MIDDIARTLNVAKNIVYCRKKKNYYKDDVGCKSTRPDSTFHTLYYLLFPAMLNVDTITYTQLAKVFDHAILKPEHTPKDVEIGCKVALECDAKSVCVKPCDVKQAAEILKGSNVLVGTVISFPHGNSPTSAKVAEALQTVEDGAVELDVVINVGHLKAGRYDECQKELESVIRACKEKRPDIIFKIIFENAYLTKEEIVQACKISEAAGAEFVKVKGMNMGRVMIC